MITIILFILCIFYIIKYGNMDYDREEMEKDDDFLKPIYRKDEEK